MPSYTSSGCNAVVRRCDASGSADLHLKGDAFGADDGGVQRLVAVGLWRGDVVLKAARHQIEQVVDVPSTL
mgnify:CR=1 FL=1